MTEHLVNSIWAVAHNGVVAEPWRHGLHSSHDPPAVRGLVFVMHGRRCHEVGEGADEEGATVLVE